MEIILETQLKILSIHLLVLMSSSLPLPSLRLSLNMPGPLPSSDCIVYSSDFTVSTLAGSSKQVVREKTEEA